MSHELANKICARDAMHDMMHVQRFAENLQIKKAKNDTAHAQYLKDQRKNGKGSLFAFLEVARTLQTAVLVVHNFNAHAGSI